MWREKIAASEITPVTQSAGLRSGRLLQALGLGALILIYFGHGFTAYLAGNVRHLGAALLSFLLMLVFLCLCFDAPCLRLFSFLREHRDQVVSRLLVLLAVAMASLMHFNQLLLDHGMYFQARIVSLPVTAPSLAVWAVMTAAAVVLLVRCPRTFLPLLILSVVWGFLLRLLALYSVPYNPEAADMLYCIDTACKALLQGVNPYSLPSCVPGLSDPDPLVYFPLLWLPYVPFKMLSLDLRWFNLLAQLAVVGFTWFLIGRANRNPGRAVVLLVMALMPDMIWTFFYRQLSHYWLLGSVYLWLVWRRRWNWSLLAVSGLFLMRITALTALWIYLIYIWKLKGLRTALAHGAIAAGIFVLSLAPFTAVGFARFKHLFFDIFVQAVSANAWQQPLSALSAGGILQWLGLTWLILPLQVLGLLGIGLLYRLSRDRSFRTFARLSAFAYAYFLWLSGFIFVYYWSFPIVLLSTLYLIESREPSSAGSGGLCSPVAGERQSVPASVAGA